MKPIKSGIDSKKKLTKRIKPKKFIQRPAGKSGPVERIGNQSKFITISNRLSD